MAYLMIAIAPVFLATKGVCGKKVSNYERGVGLLLGSLIPSILCAILYSEPISRFKMLGFAIIMLATLVLVGHNKVTADGGILPQGV